MLFRSFIFVTGTLGEEVAIETLKHGATDYVIKPRLSRLVPSVQRALREAREIFLGGRLSAIVRGGAGGSPVRSWRESARRAPG